MNDGRQLKIAQLDAAQVERIRALEKEIGGVVVALEPAQQLANLSGEQVQRLQAVEQQMGVVLLAYRAAG
jgi:hypothetical protein